MPDPAIVTRFAPSPTGHLHKGHAWSALQVWSLARREGGRFLLRIEDIDETRCTSENTEQILQDLAWLGIDWEEPVRIQSEHRDDYRARAEQLEEAGVLYPCFCSRRDIERELENAGRAPHGSEGPVYPGTCRRLSPERRAELLASGRPHAMRLDLDRALERVEAPLTWEDSEAGTQEARPEQLGDAILVRKDIGTSYHLAVVTDDALQGITDIVRGVDLFESTHLHRLLQELLEFPVPRYHHHGLLTDAEGRRLAKRDRSITLKSIRDSGVTADELREELGFPAGEAPG